MDEQIRVTVFYKPESIEQGAGVGVTICGG